MDLVCAECGSDVVYVEVDATTIMDTTPQIELLPDSCSNPRCSYFHGGDIGHWAVSRSEWAASQGA